MRRENVEKYRKIVSFFAVVFCFLVFSNKSTYAAATSVKPSKTQISSVKMLSNTSAKITWEKVRDAQKYEVYVSVNNASYKKLKATRATSYIQETLKPGNIYLYKVRSVNGSKYSGFSSVKKIKTLAYTNPGMKISATGTTATLSWNNVKNANGYIIYKKNSGKYTRVADVSGRSYKIEGLKLATTYIFKVVPYLKNNGKTIMGTESIKSVTTSRTGYLLDLVQPYQRPFQFTDYSSTSFKMGGDNYTHGFTVMGYGQENIGNEVYFNLKGEYSSLSFTSGICDASNYFQDAMVYIYEDGKQVLKYHIEEHALPIRYTVKVKNCRQLRICVYDGRGTAFYSSVFGFGNIKLTK